VQPEPENWGRTVRRKKKFQHRFFYPPPITPLRKTFFEAHGGVADLNKFKELEVQSYAN
jgi:hypothetical protein